MTDDEVKKWRSPAANPGRNYSPSYNGRQSMEQHPAMPLMAAAAMPHNGHAREPSLSQHPALRDDHRDHHLGRDAALVGAGGLAAHEVGKNHGHRHNESVDTTGGLPPPTPHYGHHLGRDAGLTGAGGVAAYEAEKHHHGRHEPTTMAGGIGKNSTTHALNHHLGRDAGLAGAGGLAAYEAGKHRHSQNAPAGTASGLSHSSTPHSGNHHFGRDAGLAGAGGLAAHEAGNRHNGVQPTATTGGLSSSATHSGSHHYGHDAGLAGAGGLAAYEAEKHHHGRHDPTNVAGGIGPQSTPLSGPNHTHISQAGAHDSAVSSGTGVAGIGAGGLAAHGAGRHHLGQQTAGTQAHSAVAGGLGSHPTGQTGSSHHYGRGAGLTGAGGVAAYEAEKHHENNKRASKIQNPFVPRPPSPRRSAPSSRAGPTEAMAAGAIPDNQGLRSRSDSRPRSGLPTSHNDPNRPPTPFGLNGIGQPYEDMHVHQLVTAPPSQDLQQSLHHRELGAGADALAGAGAGAGAGYEDRHHHDNRRSRGFSTPPEAPSRSPNRAAKHPSALTTDSSYESSLSSTTNNDSSGTEQYQRRSDPYAPAQRANVAPWEAHQTCYSVTPPTSAGMVPPPVPWEGSDHVHHQRRQSHSPRQSMQHDGRRKSGSPATSINGQPRRLRFEDLQSAGEVPPTPTGAHASAYAPVAGHESYDGYDHNRRSQGVGEAM